MMNDSNLLDQLIEEATVDCYDEEECRIGFFTMFEDNLQMPFAATIGGRKISVIKIDCDGKMIKVLVQDELGQIWVDILDIEVGEKVRGLNWLNVYRKREQGTNL
ncbi:MAG: hypothetical protein COY80_02875 [Candidatus Pacebacteria bacterium CG_4_10_14_0_8_um_filter_42_14]|nr:MAG: hypothetical protein COY80_02875 [Candidatus Pacebacteria bacterium CG_4_10_14_0_8_um_filter_42_14]